MATDAIAAVRATLEADFHAGIISIEKLDKAFEILEDDAGDTLKTVKKLEGVLNEVEASSDKASKGVNDTAKSFEKAAVSAGVKLYALNQLKKGLKEVGAAAIELVSAESKVKGVLEATGNAAGKSLEDIRKLAEARRDLTRYNQAQQTEGLATLLTFPKVVGDEFERASKVAVDFAAATGRTLPDAMRGLGKALNDPIRGTELLQEAGINFTAETLNTIRTLDSMGRTAEAQNIILDLMEDRFKGVAEAAGKDAVGSFIRVKNAAVDNLAKAAIAADKFFQSMEAGNSTTDRMIESMNIIGDLFTPKEGDSSNIEAMAAEHGKRYWSEWLTVAKLYMEAGYVLTPQIFGDQEALKAQIDTYNGMIDEVNMGAQRRLDALEARAKALKEPKNEEKPDWVDPERLKQANTFADSWAKKTQTAFEWLVEQRNALREAVRLTGMDAEQRDRIIAALEEEYRIRSGIVEKEKEKQKLQEKEEARAKKALEDDLKALERELKQGAIAFNKKKETAEARRKAAIDANDPTSSIRNQAEEIFKDRNLAGAIDPRDALMAIKEKLELEYARRFGRQGFQSEAFGSAEDYYSRIARSVGKIKSEAEKLQEKQIEQDKAHYERTQQQLDALIAKLPQPAVVGGP